MKQTFIQYKLPHYWRGKTEHLRSSRKKVFFSRKDWSGVRLIFQHLISKDAKGETSDSKKCRNIWPQVWQSKPAMEKNTFSFSFIIQKKTQTTRSQTFDARVKEFTFKLRFSQHHGTNIMVQSFPAIAKSSLFLFVSLHRRATTPWCTPPLRAWPAFSYKMLNIYRVWNLIPSSTKPRLGFWFVAALFPSPSPTSPVREQKSDGEWTNRMSTYCTHPFITQTKPVHSHHNSGSRRWHHAT